MDSTIATQGAEERLPGSWLLSRLPESVADTLTADQREAINQVTGEGAWGLHPVNIRFSLPLLFGRFYITIVGGSEKRSPRRRAKERREAPVGTLSNIFFFLGVSVLFYLAAVFAFAVHSAIIEF